MQQQPIPIDMEIQRVKQEIQQKKLSLREVNTKMASQRAHYQQQYHFKGALGRVQRASKNIRLAQSQPIKEKLQKEKLALEQYLLHLQTLKAQGIRMITKN